MTRRISSSLVLMLLFVALAAGSTEESSGTVTGAQMSQGANVYLQENRVLQPGEKVVVYYDTTLSMNHTNTYMVTDRRLVVHTKPNTTGIGLGDITSIEAGNEPLIGKVITVRGGTAELLRLEIAPLNGGDFFLTELQTAARSAGASF